jgi:NAD(P)-dependent dehydrogenase (short-subunit alcohol dehydrogenase family)
MTVFSPQPTQPATGSKFITMSSHSPKVILVTGCSSGFGLLTAARLSSRGHHVYATMRRLDKKEALQNEALKRGGKLDILELDVTRKLTIRKCIDKIKADFGFIDVLVNNAGYAVGGAFEDLSDQELREIMETNFFGTVNVTREVIPLMRQRRKGKIINISSVSGFCSSPGMSGYTCSKWALEALSETLYYELKIFGIDVHLIQPGPYQTKIFNDNARYAARFNDEQSPYYRISRHIKRRVMDRIIDNHKDPEEIPELVEKLISQKYNPFRNIPDLESQILYALRKFLPFSVFSFFTRRAFLNGFTVDPD